MVKIAVLGYGTIGSGVVEVVERNRDVLTKKAGGRDLSEIYPGSP